MTLMEIPLSQIKAELSKMWQEITRSSVLTLVVYVPGMERAKQVSATLNSLEGQHPSRAIIVAVEPQATRRTATATVDLHTHMHGQARFGDEQITIALPDSEIAHIAEYVTPLLLSDMPVFVWFAAPPPEHRDLITHLLDLGDHLMFDSAGFQQPMRDLAELARIIRDSRSGVNYKAFHDLTWERYIPWREAVAQCFDSPYQGQLREIRQVRIGFASAAHREVQAVLQPLPATLLLGWLAVQLGWRPFACHEEPDGKIMGEMRDTTGKAITVAIAPYAVPHATVTATEESRPGSLRQGAILFVECEVQEASGKTTFRVMLDSGYKRIVTTLASRESTVLLPQWMPLEMPSEAALLAEQLSRFRYDHIYEDAVLAAHDLMSMREGA